MAVYLDRGKRLYNLDRTGFNNQLTRQARGRGLSLARLLRRDGSLIMKADVSAGRPLPDIPKDILAAAEDGTPVYIPPGKTNLVGSVVRLKELPFAYLYTIRLIDPTVMGSIQRMQELTNDYKKLESNRFSLQLTFALLYVSISLIVLLSAIWMGIGVADRLVAPIRRLISAADEVSAGNLEAQVETYRSEGDLRALGNTFNNMTSELRSQRDEILQTQEQIDQRRRFIEAVLSGVSAGVIGVDPAGIINVVNRSAFSIIDEKDNVVGKQLVDIAPSLDEVFQQAVKAGKRVFRKQITLIVEGRERTLNIQVTVEDSEERQHSFVITIDDITNLVTAQRSSAWADVARRIAHEIKNPLTPIQLSAERLQRRFGKVIEHDRDVFDRCTDTIVRQVSDIGRMVDEFSSFARMPKPAMAQGDLSENIKEAVFLQEVANPDITFETVLDDEPLDGKFDHRLMAQVFTNVIKNAVEAIEAVPSAERGKGHIKVIGRYNEGQTQIIVDVIDTGKGLPQENRQRLLEPYMTTRSKGTGLGLAIVSKIMEDHGGYIELLDSPKVTEGGRGAMMRLVLPNEGGKQPDSATLDNNMPDASGKGKA
jgi:two-component system nitrogen regulation sensor histidine kinase NtrY